MHVIKSQIHPLMENLELLFAFVSSNSYIFRELSKMEEDPLIPQRMRDISRTQGNIIVFFFILPTRRL
jgi:hypothetical protein